MRVAAAGQKRPQGPRQALHGARQKLPGSRCNSGAMDGGLRPGLGTRHMHADIQMRVPVVINVVCSPRSPVGSLQAVEADEAMKVTGVGTGAPASKSRRTQGRSGSSDDFASRVDDGGEARQTAAPAKAGPLTAMDALLALQGVPGRGEDADRDAAERGGQMLDLLDDIRLGLLDGRVPKAALGQLRSLVEAERGKVSDPRLAEVLAEIDVRAAVELAKLDRIG